VAVEPYAEDTVLVVHNDLDELVLLKVPDGHAAVAARACYEAVMDANTQHRAHMHARNDTLDKACGQVPFTWQKKSGTVILFSGGIHLRTVLSRPPVKSTCTPVEG
jgi:hypothetical protein